MRTKIVTALALFGVALASPINAKGLRSLQVAEKEQNNMEKGKEGLYYQGPRDTYWADSCGFFWCMSGSESGNDEWCDGTEHWSELEGANWEGQSSSTLKLGDEGQLFKNPLTGTLYHCLEKCEDENNWTEWIWENDCNENEEEGNENEKEGNKNERGQEGLYHVAARDTYWVDSCGGFYQCPGGSVSGFDDWCDGDEHWSKMNESTLLDLGDEGQFYADIDAGILYHCTFECEDETNFSEWIWENDCNENEKEGNENEKEKEGLYHRGEDAAYWADSCGLFWCNSASDEVCEDKANWEELFEFTFLDLGDDGQFQADPESGNLFHCPADCDDDNWVEWIWENECDEKEGLYHREEDAAYWADSCGVYWCPSTSDEVCEDEANWEELFESKWFDMGDEGQFQADADSGILYHCTFECEDETNWSEWNWENDCPENEKEGLYHREEDAAYWADSCGLYWCPSTSDEVCEDEANWEELSASQWLDLGDEGQFYADADSGILYHCPADCDDGDNWVEWIWENECEEKEGLYHREEDAAYWADSCGLYWCPSNSDEVCEDEANWEELYESKWFDMGDEGQFYADADSGILYHCTFECEDETNFSEWIWENDCSNEDDYYYEDDYWCDDYDCYYYGDDDYSDYDDMYEEYCYEEAVCAFDYCEEHEYMSEDFDCWKELCIDCNDEIETCNLWHYDYTEEEWITEECEQEMDFDIERVEEIAEFVQENFNGTIVASFDVFCPDNTCLHRAQRGVVNATKEAMIPEMLDMFLANDEQKNLAETTISEFSAAFGLDQGVTETVQSLISLENSSQVAEALGQVFGEEDSILAGFFGAFVQGDSNSGNERRGDRENSGN